VLFPDPWPKTRHFKRRIVQPAFVADCARVLKSDGLLRVATDVKSYVDWTLMHVRANPAFAWTARRPADWREPPADHVRTRYETKNIGDCPPVYLDFRRG
jgi:tRNA (guanine-N7-)-methyltransferase